MSNFPLIRLSYVFPDRKQERYWELDSNSGMLKALSNSDLKRSVKIKDANGDWGNWEIDYCGYYCFEEVPFFGKAEFCVYTDSDEDFLYLKGKNYNLEDVHFLYEKGLFVDCFLIKTKKTNDVLLKYKYLRPVWRSFSLDPLMDEEDVFPLSYIKKFIEEKAWKRERQYKSQNTLQQA